MDCRGDTEITTLLGQKRQSDDDLENEQRLAKRLNLLDIADIDRLYTHQQPPLPRRTRSNAFSDSMNVDDSRDKIFIHNLDDELSDIESEEERLVFLPDIEKRLTKIPKSILANHDQQPTGHEIVLYEVPESLSIPRDQDSVRKAIIESRERAREKHTRVAAGGVEAEWTNRLGKTQTSEKHSGERVEHDPRNLKGYDEDAMDIG